ncbi:MAG: hypothetical protein IPK65_11895 [Gammaproteobacteria bacterium]|nr:hypothetical protein [Gammaproteobacteria bacterium]
MSNKKLRVMMLTHFDLVPPDDPDRNDPRMPGYQTEHDVRQALLTLGHEARIVGVGDDLTPVRNAIDEWKPHIAFNLLEGSRAMSRWTTSSATWDALAALHRLQPARAAAVARQGAFQETVEPPPRPGALFRHLPRGIVTARGARPAPFPMLVKQLQQGSFGISQASVVDDADELIHRVVQVQEMSGGDVIAEQFIEGRELYATVIGNNRLQVAALVASWCSATRDEGGRASPPTR